VLILGQRKARELNLLKKQMRVFYTGMKVLWKQLVMNFLKSSSCFPLVEEVIPKEFMPLNILIESQDYSSHLLLALNEVNTKARIIIEFSLSQMNFNLKTTLIEKFRNDRITSVNSNFLHH